MPANVIDLTTVALVKSWLSANGTAPTNTLDDPAVQACITAFSAMFLRRTGKGPQDGTMPSSSPFVAPVTYTEVYDGNGSFRMFLRNSPIQSVTSLIIGLNTIQASSGFGQAGYAIEGSKRSLVIRGGSNIASTSYDWAGGWGWGFQKGIQNIQVVYSAGFASTPADIELCARKCCALTYVRKSWTGLKNKSMGQGAGSTSYDDSEWPEDVERLIIDYTRYTL